MKTSTILVLCLGAMCSPVIAEEFVRSEWSTAVVGEGVKPALSFGPNGDLFIMGMTEEFGGVVWLAKSKDLVEAWNPIDVANGYFYGPGDLTVDKQGTAHLAWHDHDLQDAVSASVDLAGNVTTHRTITPNTHDGWDNSLAYTSTGQLIQASVNPSGFGASESLVYSELVNNEWQSETLVGSGPFMYGFSTALAVERNDAPHILFTSAEDWTTPGDLVHAQRVDGDWIFETVVTDGVRGRFPSLVFDDQDRGHAAWLDIDAEEPFRGTVQYGLYQDGVWSVQAVDELEEIQLGFSGGRKQVSIAVDDAGTPHIAYGDRVRIGYAQPDEDGWLTTTVLESDDVLYNGQVVLDLAPETNAPAIAYFQNDDEVGAIVKVIWRQPTLAPNGDFNSDNAIDALDIDLLRAEIASGRFSDRFDVTQDGVVGREDYDTWVTDLANTYAGDATLDGQFSAADLVAVFAGGEYEDGIEDNSGWATGDWNADFEFDSSDLVTALAAGGYEAGPRAAAVPEPEPITHVGLLTLFALLAWRGRISADVATNGFRCPTR